MSKPHVLVIPAPAQGHVLPLMELSLCLVKHGFRITFVNTEFTHKRVVDAFGQRDNVGDQLRLVSIPDVLESDEERAEPWKIPGAVWWGMGKKVEELIKEINRADSQEITCMVADVHIGWALEAAAKMGIRRAAFWPAAAMVFVVGLSIPKMIDDGIIDSDGTPMEDQTIQLLPEAPAMNNKKLMWACFDDPISQKNMFNITLRNHEAVKVADWLLCNSAYDFEPAAFDSAPQIIPIGPLLEKNRLGNSAGHFSPEDLTCMKWLDEQPPCSVIYVAFGSITTFNQIQFQELALGLELSNRPFLWVVRLNSTDDMSNAYPEGFLDRVATRGKIMDWAPQQIVLCHPSVACFLSHCGWNSTMEGVSNAVPFLCWPYFSDQFLNKSYICDIWKVGLGFNPNESGIVLREEIREKVEQLIGDKSFKERALNLKGKAVNTVRGGGRSYNNLKHFFEWMKE